MEPSEIAERLATATRERRARAPFTDDLPRLDVTQAYEAQWAGVEARLEAGERLVGAKLGLTSRAKQLAMNVDSPLYGFVTSGMLATYGEPVELSTLIHPRVEPEIAFLISRDIPTPATVTTVLACTEAVFAAVDVLDSRYHDFRFSLPDVVADNASAALFLLGPKAVRPEDAGDLRLLGCVLRSDGQVVATAAGAAVMGHPAAPVAWLANRLAETDRVVKAGWMVFSGGLTEPVPLRPGGCVTAEFAELGTIDVAAG